MKKIIYLSAIIASVMSSTEAAQLFGSSVQPTPYKRARMMEPVAGNNAEGAAADLLERLVAAREANEEQKNALTRLNAELVNTEEELEKANQVIHDRDSALTQQQEKFRALLADKNQEMQKQLEEANKRIAELESANPEGKAAAAEDTIAFQARIVELEEQNASLQRQVSARLQLLVRPDFDKIGADWCKNVINAKKMAPASKALNELYDQLTRSTYAEICQFAMLDSWEECQQNVNDLQTKAPTTQRRSSTSRSSVADKTSTCVQGIQELIARAQTEYQRLQSAEAESQGDRASVTTLRAEFSAIDAEFKAPVAPDATREDIPLPANISGFKDVRQMMRAYRDKLDAIAGEARETLIKWWEPVNGSEMTQGDKREIEESDVLGLIRALDGMLRTLAERAQILLRGGAN